ncbi:MAG TPA: DUF6152 family protein, partial [Candidatus Acidoferrum sp.]|nr:DUF6152 family protein [Candidatus Acidoferrum sp.]
VSSGSAFAQRALQAKFDKTKTMTLTGIVTNVDWKNPYAHVFVNVKDGNQVVNWAVELESPLVLKASGWNNATVKPGDTITVKGIRARDGSRQVWSESFSKGNTVVFSVKDLHPAKPAKSEPAPRGSDGKVIFGTAAGYWGFPSSSVLVEDGAKVSMDRFGQLANLADAPKVAPLQPWALALYKRRQERDLRDDPLFLHCKPPGGPRQYQSDFGIKFVEDKATKRMFILMGSGNHNYRIIYMDGRQKVGVVTGDDDNPLYFGRSIGKWEGDTLVATTKDFNEDFWMSNGGLPHTSNLVLTERFTRLDMNTLQYQVTIDDHGAYTRPWTASWTMQWVPDQELPIFFCQDNRP